MAAAPVSSHVGVNSQGSCLSQNNSSDRSCPTADSPPPVSSKIDNRSSVHPAAAGPAGSRSATSRHILKGPMRATPRFIRFRTRTDHDLSKLECGSQRPALAEKTKCRPRTQLDRDRGASQR